MNTVQPSFDITAGLIAVISAAATFAVCRWRIMDLERRVQILEASERDHADRVIIVETKLDAITAILQRIEGKLDAN